MEKARFILASVIASVTLLAACAYDALSANCGFTGRLLSPQQ